MIQSFSSVNVIDYSDVGQLSLYLTGTRPTTVVYDPNAGTYNPNWASERLTITPVITYNGS